MFFTFEGVLGSCIPSNSAGQGAQGKCILFESLKFLYFTLIIQILLQVLEQFIFNYSSLDHLMAYMSMDKSVSLPYSLMSFSGVETETRSQLSGETVLRGDVGEQDGEGHWYVGRYSGEKSKLNSNQTLDLTDHFDSTFQIFNLSNTYRRPYYGTKRLKSLCL